MRTIAQPAGIDRQVALEGTCSLIDHSSGGFRLASETGVNQSEVLRDWTTAGPGSQFDGDIPDTGNRSFRKRAGHASRRITLSRVPASSLKEVIAVPIIAPGIRRSSDKPAIQWKASSSCHRAD